MWLGAIAIAIAIAGAGCGSSGGGGDGGNMNDGGVPSLSGAISWKDNGAATTTTFAAAARVKSATLDMVQVTGSNSGGTGLSFAVATPPPLVPGSYSCGIGANMEIVSFAYTVGSASGNVFTCAVDIETIGEAAGTKVTGTFSATVPLDNGMTRTITGGVFDVAQTVSSL
jgi:hypothetical protein